MDPTILRVIGPGFLNQVPTLWCVELAQGSLFGFGVSGGRVLFERKLMSLDGRMARRAGKEREQFSENRGPEYSTVAVGHVC